MKKNLTKGILALFLVAVTLTPTFAENWIQIGDKHYIDADSVRSSNSYGAYTMRTKYIGNGEPLEIINGHDVWTIKTNSFVDCTSNYAKTTSYTAYDKKGNVVTSGRTVWKQWYEINHPNSRAYESYAFICTDKYLESRTGYDKLWLY